LRYSRQVGSSMKEEFEDIVAEVEADLAIGKRPARTKTQ
jgi:hypothetical protein